jgi:ParB-like chromosome segregation protein Spo0J
LDELEVTVPLSIDLHDVVIDLRTARPTQLAQREDTLGRLDLQPATATVAVSALRAADSPRLGGIDADHSRALAEVRERLPPIIVKRRTMQVIDGMHRLSAAQLSGAEEITVLFFDGTDEDAFLLAVKANILHGLPLTLAERRAATSRIISTHPWLSDRVIAAVVGLAAKTVAGVRNLMGGEAPRTAARVGRDGRVRPLNAAGGRLLAAEVIAAHSEASLREVAERAGISLGTARDVRRRVRAGEHPVPLQQRSRARSIGNGRVRRSAENGTQPWIAEDVESILAGLRIDPSLRYTEAGRSLLRWLGSRTVTQAEWQRAIDQMPAHCMLLASKLARACAQNWLELADELDRRVSECEIAS